MVSNLDRALNRSPLHGSLNALKKWCWVVKPQIQSRSYLVSQSGVINDLSKNIRSSVRLFSENCVLYRNIKSPMDCLILEDDLNSLAQWKSNWHMKFNVAKCHSMRVTWHLPDKQIHTASTKIGTGSVRQIPGITITDDLDWCQHISEISSKAT